MKKKKDIICKINNTKCMGGEVKGQFLYVIEDISSKHIVTTMFYLSLMIITEIIWEGNQRLSLPIKKKKHTKNGIQWGKNREIRMKKLQERNITIFKWQY